MTVAVGKCGAIAFSLIILPPPGKEDFSTDRVDILLSAAQKFPKSSLGECLNYNLATRRRKFVSLFLIAFVYLDAVRCVPHFPEYKFSTFAENAHIYNYFSISIIKEQNCILIQI